MAVSDADTEGIASGIPTIRRLLILAVPALLIGVVSALVLWAMDEVSALLEHGIWEALPAAIGADPDSGWWIFGVLTLTGLAVGLSVWLLPGHGGPDSATTELVAPPLPLRSLPVLALVTILALAGGVSLGPENPIIAINVGLFVTAMARIWPSVPAGLILTITAAATIGALFGTPVAAALVFTGMLAAAPTGGQLWDRLFLPLVAAAAGSVTMTLLAHPTLALPLPAYTSIAAIDLLSCAVIAAIAAGIGIAMATVFPLVHRSFRLLRNPALYITLGGIVLGILGAIGGPITLFKGLAQMGDLVAHHGDYAAGTLVLIIAVKVVALVIAAASGFRGGRIFPAVFIGTAIGVLANALIPAIPPTVAIAAGVLGMTLAIARDGWIALFVAVAVTGGVLILPVLCIAILPVWLLVSRAPEMIVRPDARENRAVSASDG